MSRFELGGKGDPIPLEALPDEFSADTAAIMVQLEDGVDFHPAEYLTFGFTHFEAWCVGAAGGSGGDARSDKTSFSETNNVQTIPAGAIWNAFIAANRQWYGDPVYTSTGYKSIQLYVQELYPTHQYMVDTYSDPVLGPPFAWGGAGGGGGLHVVSGILADLSEAVPVEVGQAGLNGASGHKRSNGNYIVLPEAVEDADTYPAQAPFWHWQSRYPLPNPSFSPPQPGGNGGVSSFGDVCIASGGKGGKPAIRWVSGVPVLYGDGGEGGIGGQAAAGGGAPGATTLADAPDGTWDGEIGQGGGGGRSGSLVGGLYWNDLNNAWFFGTGDLAKGYDAGNGGQGSFSYADTSVYGPRQRKQSIQVRKPGVDIGWGTALVHSGVPSHGYQGLDPGPPTILPVLGGGGGGARVKTLKYGSYAPDYSPTGLVVLRLYKAVV